jgi:hypothetical protein
MGDHCPDLMTGNTRDHGSRAAGFLVFSGPVLLVSCGYGGKVRLWKSEVKVPASAGSQSRSKR